MKNFPSLTTDAWEEEKHPRRPDGKFGKGGGENKSTNSNETDTIKIEITNKVLETGIKCQKVNYPPKPVDVDSLLFDDEHINKERRHFVTEEEAKSDIRNAVVSLTRWNGKTEIYCAVDGWAYVVDDNVIRTVFKSEEFDDVAKKVQEVLKQYEKNSMSIDK